MKATSTMCLAISLGYLLSFSSAATADYSPRDFFLKAPPKTFYTEDEMSNDDKEAVLRANFRPSSSFSCSAWGVAEESPTSLMLRFCPNSYVRIESFPEKSGDVLVAVESNRSSGRAFDLRFFKVDRRNNALTELSENHVKAIGIEEISENDLVSDTMRFPSGTAEKVFLSLDDSGRPKATLARWNDARWRKRSVKYDISFEWDGSRFHKKISLKR